MDPIGIVVGRVLERITDKAIDWVVTPGKPPRRVKQKRLSSRQLDYRIDQAEDVASRLREELRLAVRARKKLMRAYAEAQDRERRPKPYALRASSRAKRRARR